MAPSVVDDAAEDLGAADVDAARPGSRGVLVRSSSVASRSMCWTRDGRRLGAPAAASSPAAACRNVEAAVASWAFTSGLASRTACTVRQIGQ